MQDRHKKDVPLAPLAKDRSDRRGCARCALFGCINTEKPNADIEVVAVASARGALDLAGLRGGVPGKKLSEQERAHEKLSLPGA